MMSLAPLRSPLSTHRRKDLVCMGKVKKKRKTKVEEEKILSIIVNDIDII